MSSPPDYIALKVTEQGSAQVKGNVGLSLTKGKFSISAWILYDAFSSNATIVERQGEFVFRTMDNGFFFQITGRAPVVWQSPDALNEGWYNVCVTYDTGTIRIYVDGDFKKLGSVAELTAESDKPLAIGSGLQGLITRVVIYNQALSATQVMDAQYNEPVSSLIAAYFDFSQNPPVDKGPKALPITLAPGASSVLVTPGLHLLGNSYAYPMHDAAINPGGRHDDPYSVQAWVYLERGLPDQYILANCDLDAETGMALKLSYNAGRDMFYLVSRRGTDESRPSVTSSVEVPTKTWTNVATTYDGSKLTVYVNGKAAGEQDCGPIPLSRPFGDLIIGGTFSATGNGAVKSFQGYLSRVEIWKIALSAADVAKYQDTFPGPTAEGLAASYDLTTAPTQNNANGHPVGLADGARLGQLINPAPATKRLEAPVAQAETPTLGAERLSQWREAIDHTDFLAEHGQLLDEACEADTAEFDDATSKQKIRDAYADAKRRLAAGIGSDMAVTVTRHEENGRRYLVGHDRRGSYIAYEADIVEIDECTLWKIQLLFVIIAGALDAIFGVRANLTGPGRTILRSCTRIPAIASLLANGSRMTATLIFRVISRLVSAGVLRSLIWAVVDLGFWAILRVIARMLLTFLGVGAADVIASLVATALLFIKVYSERPESCDPLPNLTVSAIKFNHDPTQSSVDALSIRRNKAIPVPIPEWTFGMLNAIESPAAYAMAEVIGKVVTVQVKFMVDTQKPVSLQVRATGGGILGAHDAFSVNFVNGVSVPEYVTLKLPHHTLANGGIRASDIQWDWQYKQGNLPWKPAQISRHRIYTMFRKPTMPWRQNANPSDSQLPWADALEYACTWASGQTNDTDALTKITQNINGGYGLQYDTNNGASFYTIQGTVNGWVFNLSSFLGLLGGGAGKGHKVNCTDCGTIVATFANLLGCNVQASVMGDYTVGFSCNKIIAIGSAQWAYPFPQGGGGLFSYHEVTWTGASGRNDHIFDACLKLDSSNDPWNWVQVAGHTAVLPTNFQFTTQPIPLNLPIATPFTEQTYRERLATNTADGIGKCTTQGQWPTTQSGRRYVI